MADDHVVTSNRQYFPELQLAFDLDGSHPLAWAFSIAEDSSRYEAAARFLDNHRASRDSWPASSTGTTGRPAAPISSA